MLLKGPSIAHWLYSDGEPRAYIDVDVLVAPADRSHAEAVLDSLGYTRHFDDRKMPEWWREHAGDWVRDRDGATIDLHSRLPGIGAAPSAAWAVLAGELEEMLVAGRRVPVLSLPARAMHVALHAAHHGAGHAQPLRDLERAIAAADEATWRRAAALASQLQAADALAAGLRLQPAGAVLADQLELPRDAMLVTRLRAGTPPAGALAFAELASARGVLGRATIAWHKLVPPPAFVRHWDPRAREGRVALLRAYLRRPIWLLRHARRGWVAFARARRGAGR